MKKQQLIQLTFAAVAIALGTGLAYAGGPMDDPTARRIDLTGFWKMEMSPTASGPYELYRIVRIHDHGTGGALNGGWMHQQGRQVTAGFGDGLNYSYSLLSFSMHIDTNDLMTGSFLAFASGVPYESGFVKMHRTSLRTQTRGWRALPWEQPAKVRAYALQEIRFRGLFAPARTLRVVAPGSSGVRHYYANGRVGLDTYPVEIEFLFRTDPTPGKVYPIGKGVRAVVARGNSIGLETEPLSVVSGYVRLAEGAMGRLIVDFRLELDPEGVEPWMVGGAFGYELEATFDLDVRTVYRSAWLQW